MNRVLRILGGILIGVLALYLIWRFANIITYLAIAILLSLIGRPLVKRFNAMRIGRFHIPNALSALLALLVIILVVLSFVGIFVPLIASQARLVNDIDFDLIGSSMQKPIADVEIFLRQYNILTREETIRQLFAQQIDSILNFASFSKTLASVVGVTGSMFLAVFAILFLTYFFMKDSYLIDELVDTLTPINYQNEVQSVLTQSKRLLSRYFIGLMIELTTMITLLSLGLTLFGIENALLIGFFGGLMNVIPYLGPIIGAALGIILTIFTALSTGMISDLFSSILIVLGVFAVSNLLDNVVLQPLIYSNSVKAHPVEIFLVILIAGSMAGIPGMILAVPTYTVLRVIAKEFLSQVKVVQQLTKNI
ncbi:MAG TPA: AI-2E family transporter [Bacteroidales bacterium]|nr:AI-2E family transporter [Bacteroidales bacterium]